MGEDIAGQGNPGSPGSDGASPYQRASPFPQIVLVLVLVLVLDLFDWMPVKNGRSVTLSPKPKHDNDNEHD